MSAAPNIPLLFEHLTGNYMFQTSNYALFFYDYLLTLPDEVEKIWMAPFTFASLLFYINRYVTHAQFIILQVEYHEKNWPIALKHLQVCDHYVKFAGACAMSLVAIAQIIMILRVYALYRRSKRVLGLLITMLCAQMVVIGFGLNTGVRVHLPPGFPGCVLTGSNNWFATLWAAPLCTDSVIFAMTVWRSVGYRKKYGRFKTIDMILRDGSVYFLVIFSVNLMNCLIYLFAPSDLRALGARFSQTLTSILISRLQLNLRQIGNPSYIGPGTQEPPSHPSGGFGSGLDRNTAEFTTFFSLGALGEDLDDCPVLEIGTLQGSMALSDVSTSRTGDMDCKDKKVELQLDFVPHLHIV
ncbi:hypothetical protein D9619_009946 [Psilocybe cf. subviscida]|uniref:DUF6533 domain-containing protein n=1 Tax=Psilocybe cf. subviscida TaxID=2480587 RepID=A0A8H5F6I6_9AGAR|nr:hypothetical protein D9619_009946 [Psilocybe cf. subviscida]